MARRPLFWRQLALIGASVFFLCLLASFLSPSEAHPPAQDSTPTPIYLPLVLNNYPPPATVYVVSSSAYTDTIPSLYVVGEGTNNYNGYGHHYGWLYFNRYSQGRANSQYLNSDWIVIR